MIVRDTQLSDHRLAYPAAPLVRPPTAVEQKSVSIDKLAPITQQVDVVSLPQPAAESKERPLTFEVVVAWLAVQDREVKESCASILASEVTRIYETAKNEGFEAGRKAGELAGRQEVGKVLENLSELRHAAEVAFACEQEHLQTVCVEVIAEALAKIGGPLLSSEQAAIGAIKQVLTRVKESRELTIRVAREDFELVKKMDEDLASALGNRKYEIVADPRVELGGCLVETKLGSLDGRLEVQLRELYETLRLAKLTSRESAQ
jgi:flagellar assembly protein FliH